MTSRKPRPRQAPMEWDPQTCITAGELRGIGVAVPENIPDVACVPRCSMKVSTGSARSEPKDETKFSVPLVFEFSEPFRWISATFVVDDYVPVKGADK